MKSVPIAARFWEFDDVSYLFIISRNEVWRYQHYMRGASWTQLLFRGLGWGTAAFVVAVGAEKLLWKEDDHGHGSEHH